MEARRPNVRVCDVGCGIYLLNRGSTQHKSPGHRVLVVLPNGLMMLKHKKASVKSVQWPLVGEWEVIIDAEV